MDKANYPCGGVSSAPLPAGAGEEDEYTQVLCVSIGQWLFCDSFLHPWIPHISLFLSTTMLELGDTSSVWWQWADPSHDLQYSTMSWAMECLCPELCFSGGVRTTCILWADRVEYAGGAFPGWVFPEF